MDAASYYADLTANYLYYGGDAHGWHYGVWEPDVASEQESLRRSNELLFRGLRPDPSTRLLDVGCGSGGLAVWAAERFGCQATGITICAEHVEVAENLARERGVAERCRFFAMDMDDLRFADASFDVVTNQETICHSADKAAFLRSVHRVLAPGGWWRAIVFLLHEGPLSPPQERAYRDVLEGWHVPHLPRDREILAGLAEGGFADVDSTDITELVRPSAALIRRRCLLPQLATRLHADWLVYSFEPRMRSNRRGHIRASKAYSDGLLKGFIRHGLYAARRP